MKTIAMLAVLLLAGCASFKTVQEDRRTNEKTGENSMVITTAKGWTFFSGSSKLASWKATQTEKTQGASVGGVEQAGGVNAELINAAVQAAVSAAVKSVKPIP